MSIAGGVDLSVDRAARAGCSVLQIFTKSSSQWKERELGDDEIARFRARLATEKIGPVAAHDSYLINLASPDESLFRKSYEAFLGELKRCERLGIPFLIAHPGCHMGSGVSAGIRRIAAALDRAHADLPGARVRVLLEITAGQGSAVGSRFEEIGAIVRSLDAPARVGVCFDTCHAFAAGYDLRDERVYHATFDAFDRAIGIERLLAFHLNDSKKDLGSRCDRHEHIGRGWLGLEAFRLLLNDTRFQAVPMFLETPKGPDLREDVLNLRRLRSLIGEILPRRWTRPRGAGAGTGRARKPGKAPPSGGPGEKVPRDEGAETKAPRSGGPGKKAPRDVGTETKTLPSDGPGKKTLHSGGAGKPPFLPETGRSGATFASSRRGRRT